MGIGREFFKKKQEGCVWRNLHPRFEGAKNPPTDKTCIDIGSEVSGKIRRFSWRKLRPRFKGENKPSHSRFKGENKRSHRLKSHVPWLWRYMGKGVKGAPRGSCALVFKGENKPCNQALQFDWNPMYLACEISKGGTKKRYLKEAAPSFLRAKKTPPTDKNPMYIESAVSRFLT